VPLAHDCRLIASLLEQLRKERARRVNALAKLPLPVLVAVKASHEACARWRRKRVLNESLVETHAALGYTVYVGRWREFGYAMSIGTYALERVIITHYVYDVGALGF